MKSDLILTIYKLPETVFTVNQLSQLFPELSYARLKDRLFYFTKVGKLQRLRYGLYAKTDYNPLEVANKLYKPSYISLETVLFKKAVVFQYYETIFAVSYLTREVQVGEQTIQYRRMKREVLTDLSGIEEKEGYFIASVERAFLDAIFLYKDYHFDNLGGVDWEKVHELKTIYESKVFEKRVEDYYRDYKEDYGKS